MKQYITIKEVASKLAVSEQTVRRLIHNRKLDAVLVERQYRIVESNVDLALSSMSGMSNTTKTHRK